MIRWGMLAVIVGGIGLSTNAGRLGGHAGSRPAQGQAAWQFLNAVLHGNYQSAYSRLAPEVRQSISLGRFEAQARPIWKSGQRHGKVIELYKLGMRLGERGSSRLFYSFAFAADSSLKTPSELLEVTFRDTTTRAVLGFGLRNMATPGKRAIAAPAAKPLRK
ncbi:hypothetical protein [Hymenobacter negativus]|uniref:DUF4019 domain-containing protein n=1 Tax=Hymenobacter negativus TaxID=2795026 RepID=A0ABS3QMB2_9BACT|nr:hypothetical protein [Hymenobacter negativus]MBO2012403.1 hypothetical protein [Hymenobacter negativus]